MHIIKVLICLFTVVSFAQPKAVIDQTTYHFWLNEPKVVEDKTPLIIFLHGKSLSGTDINRVKRYGALKGIEKGLDIPAYLVAPQLPSGPWNPDKVEEIVTYMIKHFPIDESRIYVTGMSLGAYGTLKYTAKYPNRVAAAIAICGGGENRDACSLASVPIKLIHGDKDNIIPMKESKSILNAIQKCDSNAPVELEVIKGGTHGSVEDLYRHIELYNWLLKHQKKIETVEISLQ
ncbi:dienelactone hydrolase family protein [Myroides albus]|uniref:Phospholipase n=1 Tax=Myroides albus TaxID=2562892 RepID=A0A6I3LIJ9_9FLAO|nr:dienelactone hydrolase family protein [Myroides albus]MTG97416.1 phospholipase [Myroides albus]UVD79445.1 dienelactone hydrolase family protein [Myroides albus]